MLFEIFSRCGRDEYSPPHLCVYHENDYLRDISHNIESKLNNCRQTGIWDPLDQCLLIPCQIVSNNVSFVNGIIRYVQMVILNHEARVLRLRLVNSNFISDQGQMTLNFDAGLADFEHLNQLTILLNCRFWFKVEFK